MADPWLRRIKRTGKLTYFNKASSWNTAVSKAVETFNGLAFGVEYKTADDERSANVVIVPATSKTTYPYFGTTLKPGNKFKGDDLNGHTSTPRDGNPLQIFFACIFLPANVKGATPGQKEMVTLHELIHAAGMDDHDSMGLMYPYMIAEGDGLIEQLHDKDAKPMPPVRLGTRTRCTLPMLWMDADKFSQIEGCKKD